VEKYEDEPRYYCAYCWDESSSEFLKVLQRKGLNQGEKKEPSNSNSPVSNNNHRERERLQQSITNLTNKPNKTPAEEQDLAKKRKELAELDKKGKNPNNTEQNNNNSWLKPTLIIGGGLLIIGVIAVLFIKKNKNKR
jgi:hypothetical protein